MYHAGGFPPKFSLCNLSPASWASSSLSPTNPPAPPRTPSPRTSTGLGVVEAPCSLSLPGALLPPALAQSSHSGCPSLAFAIPGPVPTHRPPAASRSSHPALCRQQFPTSDFSPQLGGLNGPSSRLPHNRCSVNNLCLKLGDPERQRTYCVP